MEIVVHGTLEATLVEVLLIGDAGIQLVVIRRFECHIAEVHQDDNALLWTKVIAEVTHSALLLQVLDTTRIDAGTLLTGSDLDGLGIHFRKVDSVVYLIIGTPVVSQPVVTMLVAYQSCTYSGSVAQCERLSYAPLSGY